MQNALEPEKPEPAEKKNSGGGQGGQGTKPPGGGVHTLAELKLLRIMQDEVNRRTRELDATFGQPGKLSEEARQQYTALGEEQGRLANLLLDLIRPVENPEDNPDSLPAPEEAQGGAKPTPPSEPGKAKP